MDSIENIDLQTDETKNYSRIAATDISKNSAKTAEKIVIAHGVSSLFWRLCDVICSLAVLVILLPFFVVIFILLKMETSATAFAVSESLSPGLNKFKAVNFRCSKLIDGEQIPTRIGNALKSTGADQLPLLFNVLRGDISLGEAFQISALHKKTLTGDGADYSIIGDVQWFSTELKTKYPSGGSNFFWASKRLFDIVASLVLLPVLGFAAIILLVLNPFWNKGELFYTQKRMGRYCQPFKAIKFRSMSGVKAIARGPDDPMETDRITALGKFLRKCRLDELPQILNVLAGQMSLIGPRPDYYPHAASFIKNVPGYRERHMVRPGISGLAQVNLGYAEGTDATRQKVNADHNYIKNAGFTQEATLVLRTIKTVLSRAGS